MSLQVWLPFTDGTLKQQGLSSNIITCASATYETNGKLGQCLKIDNYYSTATIIDALVNKKQMSCSFWLKLNSGSDFTVFSDIVSFGIANASGGSTVFRCEVTSSNGTSINWFGNGYITDSGGAGSLYSLNLDTWMHMAVVIDGTTIKTYQNGILKNTYTIPSSYLSYYFNGRFSFGDNGMHCSLNDVRIYDHCLSPMEVKELSKGLVLHYPLNRQGWGQENLILNSNTFAVGGGATGITPSTTAEGYHQVIAASGNGNWHASWATATSTSLLENTFAEGDLFTISFTIKSENANTTQPPNIYVKSGMGYYTMKGKVTSDWSTVYYSGTWKDTNAIAFHLGFTGLVGTYLFKNWKVEKGSIPTPWCPNSADELADTMGLNSNIEYDTSGFNNNGEWFAYDSNGDIIYTSDTPKYEVSTHIVNDNATVSAPSGTRYLYGHCELTNPNQMSVAFWCKPIKGYSGNGLNGIFCTTNYAYGNSYVGNDYQTSAMNHRDGTIDINESTGANHCRVSAPFTVNEWHHYCITYDGQVGRMYKDGVQVATNQFSIARELCSCVGVVVGYSYAGGVYRRNDAYYSDFRVYATALSASDVLSLYQNSAYIDSNGNVYGAVHSEV